MLRSACLVLLLAAPVVGLACSSSNSSQGSSGGNGDDGGGAGDDGGAGADAAPKEPNSKFASTAGKWAVPSTGAGSLSGFDSMTWPGGGNNRWFTFDLDGDGKPDLVQTSDPSNGNVWGGDSAASWKVFKNTGNGFDSSATKWAVPPSGAGSLSGFDSLTWPGGGNNRWFTFDLDGDGKPDLVQTSDPSNGNVWGGDSAASWKVYKNTGNGFDSSATKWAVPPSGSGTLSGLNSTTWPGGGNNRWFTFDLDGDGKPDLVQTSDPSNGNVWGGDSAASWKVYKNTGNGFDSSATKWAVPPSGSGTLSGLNSTTWPGGGNNRWFTFDLDGDGKPDLVQTSDPSNGNVWGGDSAASWKVFKNTGSGFDSSATKWAVPPSGSGTLSGLNSTSWPGGGNNRWFTFDLDGDGKPDLVQTSDPSNGNVWGGDSAASWKVFKNTGGGFDSSASKWSVPPTGAGSLSGFDSTSWPGGGNNRWFSFDLNGDGYVDLVQTSDPSNGNVWGGDSAASWKVYASTR